MIQYVSIRRGMATVTWVIELLGSDIVKEAEKINLTPEAFLNLAATDVPAGCDGLYTVLNWLACLAVYQKPLVSPIFIIQARSSPMPFFTAKARYLSGGSQGDSSVNTMVPQWDGMIRPAFTSFAT